MITHWLTEIVHKVKPAMAKAYISALQSIHQQNHYDTKAFNDPRIDLILHGAKCIYGEGERRTHLPLTSESSRTSYDTFPKTSMDSTSRGHSVWHLPDSYDL